MTNVWQSNAIWILINMSRGIVEGRKDSTFNREQAVALAGLLAAHSPREIVAFENAFTHHMLRANTWGLLVSAALIGQGTTDDQFEYFRAWLVGQGKEAFERAVVDPDTLADVVDSEADNEHLLYSASRAYEVVSASGLFAGLAIEMPRAIAGRTGFPPTVPNPSGQPWSEAEVPERLPRLWSRFGSRVSPMDWFPKLQA